jgi:PIN domain nuclease of toxin-antitoxin system
MAAALSARSRDSISPPVHWTRRLDWFQDPLRMPTLRVEPVRAVIAAHAAGFDLNVHGGAADRIILATASVLGLPLANRWDRHRPKPLERTSCVLNVRRPRSP